MNQPNDTRLMYDDCSYKEKLKRTVGPGLYHINTPYNDCMECEADIPADPYLRYQKWGPNTCTMKSAVDDSSELLGLNYKLTKCNADEYLPGKYSKKGACAPRGNVKPRDCDNRPQESTRLSNPPCTLKGTGWNRWEWLCVDPQEHALEYFDWPQNYRMIAKDNHVPCLEKPQDQSVFFPSGQNNIPSTPEILEKWKINTPDKSVNMFAPGYPHGYFDYNKNCKEVKIS